MKKYDASPRFVVAGARRHCLNQQTFGPVERPVFSWQKEMVIEVEVTSQTGESWNFSEKDFATWKRTLGGDVGFLWKSEGDSGDGAIIDTARLLKGTLRPGKHQGVPVVKTPLPEEFGQANVEAWQLA